MPLCSSTAARRQKGGRYRETDDRSIDLISLVGRRMIDGGYMIARRVTDR